MPGPRPHHVEHRSSRGSQEIGQQSKGRQHEPGRIYCQHQADLAIGNPTTWLIFAFRVKAMVSCSCSPTPYAGLLMFDFLIRHVFASLLLSSDTCPPLQSKSHSWYEDRKMDISQLNIGSLSTKLVSQDLQTS